MKAFELVYCRKQFNYVELYTFNQPIIYQLGPIFMSLFPGIKISTSIEDNLRPENGK